MIYAYYQYLITSLVCGNFISG